MECRPGNIPPYRCIGSVQASSGLFANPFPLLWLKITATKTKEAAARQRTSDFALYPQGEYKDIKVMEYVELVPNLRLLAVRSAQSKAYSWLIPALFSDDDRFPK
jgi:hypothetical protein